MILTTHFHSVPGLRISELTPLFPPYGHRQLYFYLLLGYSTDHGKNAEPIETKWHESREY